MRHWLIALTALFAIGCYERHDRSYPTPDAGTSRFEGRWLIDQPYHAAYESTEYELAPDGRFIPICSFGGRPGPPGTTAFVGRDRDGMRCDLVGPWSSREETVLTVQGFCDDSVSRTVVLDVVWDVDRPSSVEVQKVDGEEEGWTHPGWAWRWLPCSASPRPGEGSPGECGACD